MSKGLDIWAKKTSGDDQPATGKGTRPVAPSLGYNRDGSPMSASDFAKVAQSLTTRAVLEKTPEAHADAASAHQMAASKYWAEAAIPRVPGGRPPGDLTKEAHKHTTKANDHTAASERLRDEKGRFAAK